MFLVEKAISSSHFKSKQPLPKISNSKPYEFIANSFHQNLLNHLKTLNLTASDPPEISLSWLSTAVSVLTSIHSESEHHISDLKLSDHSYQVLYMDYSLKVLDLCNLISFAVKNLTEKRLLINYSLRLLNFAGDLPPVEKLNKAKEKITRSVEKPEESVVEAEKGARAAALIDELTVMIGKLVRPRGKILATETDFIRRMFYTVAVITVFISRLLVTVLFGGGRDSNEFIRVSDDFDWAESVNAMQTRMFEVIKRNVNKALEVDNVEMKAVTVRDLINDIVSDDGADKAALDDGVKELASAGKTFSDGVDALTNGVNGLFSAVLKTRNGRLDI
uniref:UPF0496 protein 4-like n=1 Tax=Erigeron canadensis TaxID=72917 RepID=UPI001CB9CBBA|nr:UPF0496 protein 4-like [Erigeron canadensis]